ncbi:uncharacterized protein [Anolis sagrei]|uniref:uncharacterized protein n=1 Tax=Anolis sagrei TaxID=38937 RepID=UPI0035229E4F
MEQSYSRRSSMAFILKDGKLVHHSEKSMDAGQCHLSKGRSRRLTSRRRSNSVSMCVLPSIPEYPGFQDIKRHYTRGNSVLQDLGRTRLENSPSTRVMSLNRNLGHPMDRFAKGHSKKSFFYDTTLQDHYNDRLMEFRSYGTKKSNGKGNENQKPSFTSHGLRRRNSCGARMQDILRRLSEDSCDSDQIPESMPTCPEDEGTNPECCKKTYLESLILSINAPLEMLVRRE